MLQQEYSEELKKVRERWKIWLNYFNTFESRPRIPENYCEIIADSFVAERAEERDLPALLSSIPDETILLALKREKQTKSKG